VFSQNSVDTEKEGNMTGHSEDALLAIVSRSRLDEPRTKTLKGLLQSSMDWPYVEKKCLQEGVTCLAYSHLKKPDLCGAVPAYILKAWEKEYYLNSFRNTVIAERTKEAVDALQQHGIQPLLLKGLYLAENVYGNIALRPMYDVDILIRNKDLPSANGVLKACGYIEPPLYSDLHAGSFHASSSLNSLVYTLPGEIAHHIHLHWHIINSTWPLGNLEKAIDMDGIWEKAVPASVADGTALALCPEHLAIYLSHHAHHHHFYKLILLTDILETLEHYKDRIDWTAVRDTACLFGLPYIVYEALFFTSRMLGYDIPQLESMKPLKRGLFDKGVFFLERKWPRSYLLSYCSYLCAQDGLTERLGFVGRTLSPSHFTLSKRLRSNACSPI
jgi:hypothetical protein